MYRHLCCALAALVLLAGCSALREHQLEAVDDEDSWPTAAAFLGYHGPVDERKAMGGPPAPDEQAP